MSSLVQYAVMNPAFVFFLSASIVFMVLWLTKKNDAVATRAMTTDLALQPWGLAVSCIDLRFQDEMQAYFEKYFGNNRFDNFIIPGPGLSLIGTSSAFNTLTDARAQNPGAIASSNYMQAFASTAALAKVIHTITRIAIMDHEDCGYYASYFNGLTAGRSMSAYTYGNAIINYGTTTSYASLNTDQQFGVSAYYMEQVKSLWGTKLLYSATLQTNSYLGSATSMTGAVPLTGVMMHSFYVYRNGYISETFNPLTVTDGV
jgi:hypothetical protein